MILAPEVPRFADAGTAAGREPLRELQSESGSPARTAPRRTAPAGRAWRTLRRAAFVAWASCVALVLALEVQHRAGVQHFSYVLGASLLALLAGATLIRATASSALVARGPSRLRAVCWGLAGLAPAALWAGVGLYAHSNWQRRHVPKDYPMDLARRAGATVMEAELALRYPHKLEGRRAVMFHHGNLANPGEDLARMDAFLDELGHRYGREVRTPIHWARGTAAGQGGASIYGLALGSDEDPVSTEGPGAAPERAGRGLQALDRHEVAHAVMSQWMPPGSDPPTLLSEGWAEAVAREGARPHPLDLVYGPLPPPGRVLATLMGPDHYRQNSGLVYPIGHCLVRLLLDRYGHEKFFELYRTIRPGNVAQRFAEVYGTDVATIERELFEDIPRPRRR